MPDITPITANDGTYNTDTAATSHQVSLASPIANPRRSIVLGSHDNFGTINQITSVTDDKSNTWVQVKSGSNGTIDSEVWLCKNPAIGTQVVTVNYANSVKATLLVREYDKIVWWASPVDDAQTGNTGPATTHNAPAWSQRTQQKEIIFSLFAWVSTTITASAAASFSDLLQDKNSTNGIALAMANRKYTDANTNTAKSSPTNVARMSTSGSTTGVIIGVLFMCEGVYTTSAEDGTLLDTLGSITKDTTKIYVNQSSVNAPDGTTPSSLQNRGYLFHDTSSLPTGATGATSALLKWKPVAATDDAAVSYTLYIKMCNNGCAGTTLDSGDYNVITDVIDTRTYPLPASGVETSPLTFADLGGTVNVMFQMDVSALTTADITIGAAEGFIPAWIEVEFIYPTSTPKQWSLAPQLVRFGNENTNQRIRL